MTSTINFHGASEPSYLGSLASPRSRVSLERAAALADCAVAKGRARRDQDGTFHPGSDLRAQMDRKGVRFLASLSEPAARELDAWLLRDVS